nr:hypothetical protein [uncultured Holophaga sp.]
MSISATGAVNSALPPAKTARPSDTTASFPEISKLAVAPQDSVTLSEQAQALIKDKGVSPAFALLGN